MSVCVCVVWNDPDHPHLGMNEMICHP